MLSGVIPLVVEFNEEMCAYSMGMLGRWLRLLCRHDPFMAGSLSSRGI